MTDKKTKFCNKCQTERLKEEFSKCKLKKDGFASTCKHCVKQYRIDNKEILRQKAKIRKEKNIKRYKAYNKLYQKTEKCQKRIKKYRQSKRGKEIARKSNKKYRRSEKGKKNIKKLGKRYKNKRREYIKKYRQKNPDRARCHRKLQYAVDMGRITKPKHCTICNKTNCKIQGHHEDYSKALEVVWCCKECHYILDEERRKREKLDKLKNIV